ncbi:hypothetical protein IJZ97_04885, partial [bacterium]|nr:hypothetical protein [bacterium]
YYSYGVCSGSDCKNQTCTEEPVFDAEYLQEHPDMVGETKTVCRGSRPLLANGAGRINHGKYRVLSNGAYFWMYSLAGQSPVSYTYNNAGVIFIDVNGAGKPNQFGYDVQKLLLTRNGHVISSNIDGSEYGYDGEYWGNVPFIGAK